MLTGSVLVAFAAFCFVAAVWRELFPGAPPSEPDVHRLPRVVLFIPPAAGGRALLPEGSGFVWEIGGRKLAWIMTHSDRGDPAVRRIGKWRQRRL